MGYDLLQLETVIQIGDDSQVGVESTCFTWKKMPPYDFDILPFTPWLRVSDGDRTVEEASVERMERAKKSAPLGGRELSHVWRDLKTKGCGTEFCREVQEHDSSSKTGLSQYSTGHKIRTQLNICVDDLWRTLYFVLATLHRP